MLAQPAYVTQVIRTAEGAYDGVVFERAEAERRRLEKLEADLAKKRKRG